MSDLPEHTIPLSAFLKTLRGTPDEVYSRLLTIQHANQNKTAAAWRETLEGYRGVPSPAKGA
jgi:hypothetical protein